ncbi:MAG: hypothetical protein GF375_05230 [Candidatus Omnitrophica bacterium]|nr:hypothetical protein [Candidatus Omnitrophota bacterium]MBD3269391.1 hypothetical protein [Candidatus Omnitrophota bacterium]
MLQPFKKGKAKHSMSLIARAEKMCRAENNTYTAVTDGTYDATPGSYVEPADVDTDNDWAYVTTRAASDTFTIAATEPQAPLMPVRLWLWIRTVPGQIILLRNFFTPPAVIGDFRAKRAACSRKICRLKKNIPGQKKLLSTKPV